MSKEEKRQIKFSYGSDQMMIDAGSLSFLTPLGTKNGAKSFYHSVGTGASSRTSVFESLEGIAVLDYIFGPGRAVSPSDPINVAAKKLYTFVRHANSGSKNYDSPDLIEYVLSVLSSYLFVNQCKRAYACVLKYEATNRYYGQRLVNALGFDYDDIVTNLADFRELINVNIAKLNALKIPKDWPLLTKELFQNLGIFKDGDISKSQIYIYRDICLWKYNETGTYVGNLTPVYPFGPSPSAITVAAVKTVFDTVINALVASEDINIMSGDIMKAYGEENCYSMDLVDTNLVIEPTYNKDMLRQFHNLHFAKVTNLFTASAGNTIIQDTTTNSLYYDPEIVVYDEIIGKETVTGDNNYATRDHQLMYMDFDSDKVEPYDVITAGNMMAVIERIDTVGTTLDSLYKGNIPLYFSSFGLDLPYELRIFITPDANTVLSCHTNELWQEIPAGYSGGIWNTDGFSKIQSNVVERISRFDWAPIFYCGIIAGASGKDEYETKLRIVGDMYNYTVVTYEDLKKIHALIVLSGFGLV